MGPEIILEALRRAGATMEGEEQAETGTLTKQDLMELGLSGGAGSSKKRHALQKKLDLPERMTANAMLQALNLLYSPEDLIRIVRELEEE